MATGIHRKNGQSGNTNCYPLVDGDENKIQFGADPGSHHRLMLANMSSLVEAENLTDMTIQCSGGYYIHTHRKLLSSVSSLARKLSREHNSLGENQRLHLIINDMTRQTVMHFLKILYTGYTEGLRIVDFDNLHQLCQLLGVAFNDNSIFNFSPGEQLHEKSSKESCVNRFGGKYIADLNTLAMGSGNPVPSSTLQKTNYQPISDTSKSNHSEPKRNCVGRKKEQKNESRILKGNKRIAKESFVQNPVYCICREEERPGMIGCDFCDEWYHTQCLSLTKEEVKRLANENWSCPNCEFKRVKSKKQSSTDILKPHKDTLHHPVTSPEISEKIGRKIHSKNANKSILANVKQNNEQESSIVSPQRNKRKRRPTSDEGLNCQENINTPNNVVDIVSMGNLHSEEKKICPSSVLTATKNCEQKYHDVSDLINDETSLDVEETISKSTQLADIQETLVTEESKSGNDNGYSTGTSTKKSLTNKRMSVPLQKKPKKTFEEALFGAAAPVVPAKRSSTGEEKCVNKPSKKYVEKEALELDGIPSSNEKNTPTEPIHSVELKKSTDDVSNRTISIQSRAADDENSSHSDDTKKAKKLKKRSQFPKDRDRKSTTTSTQESSEEQGPLSSPPQNAEFIHVNNDESHNPALARGPVKSRKISSSPASNYLQPQKINKEEEDSANLLFFCYICKSIFVSKTALESHKEATNHYE